MPKLPPSIVSEVQKLASEGDDQVIAVFDANGFYLYASPNHKEAIGYTEEELLEMHLSQVVDKPEHHNAWVLRTISVFYSGPMSFSSYLSRKSGERVKVAGTLRHFRVPGGVRYFITCVRTLPS
jgi:PAS domain S-box-containing protein